MAPKCSGFERVTRNMVENLVEDFKTFRTEIREEFVSVKENQQELFNHMSTRLPLWASVFGGLGIAILSAVIGALVTRTLL
jgi:hypothetical protein